VVRRLIADQALPASQAAATAPWIIARVDLSLPAVQAAVEAVHRGRPEKTEPQTARIPLEIEPSLQGGALCGSLPEAVRAVTVGQAGLNAGAVKNTPCGIE